MAAVTFNHSQEQKVNGRSNELFDIDDQHDAVNQNNAGMRNTINIKVRSYVMGLMNSRNVKIQDATPFILEGSGAALKE